MYNMYMTHTEPGFESANSLRTKVENAYRPFISQGLLNPDALDEAATPGVNAANELFIAWCEKMNSEVGADPIARLAADVEKTTFYYDLGFHDPVYLDDVISLLDEDLQKVEEGGIHPDPELAQKIRDKIAEINKLLGEAE